MGSLLLALVGFNTVWYNQLLGPTKMLSYLSLASLLALSQAGVLPAGINAATCTNYPSVALARLVDLLICPLIPLLMRLSSSSTWPSQPFLLFQVWKLMLLPRMPSLLGWELQLGPSGTKHTWLLRPDSSSSSSSLLTSTTLIIKQGQF